MNAICLCLGRSKEKCQIRPKLIMVPVPSASARNTGRLAWQLSDLCQSHHRGLLSVDRLAQFPPRLCAVLLPLSVCLIDQREFVSAVLRCHRVSAAVCLESVYHNPELPSRRFRHNKITCEGEACTIRMQTVTIAVETVSLICTQCINFHVPAQTRAATIQL